MTSPLGWLLTLVPCLYKGGGAYKVLMIVLLTAQMCEKLKWRTLESAYHTDWMDVACCHFHLPSLVGTKTINNRSIFFKRKRKRSDPVLWRKPLHQQKCQKGKVTTQTIQQKKFDYTAVADRLRTVSWSNYGRPTGVVNLVNGPNLPTPSNSRVTKRTHV